MLQSYFEKGQICLVPGNHDLYFGGWESFFDLFGASSYTFSVNRSSSSDLFIFLDSGGGTLGNLQLEWLKELLESDREKYNHVIIVTHVNFFRSHFTHSTNILNEELLFLIDLNARYKVDMVIQGHDHKRYVEQMGHTTYLTLDALKDGTKNASYMELNISESGLNYTFVNL